MFNRIKAALALATLFSVPLAGCASAYDGAGPSEILAELPADAPPGECFAHVVVPGQPVVAPPVTAGAQWVLNPGPPGSPGPIWCLEPVAAAVAVAPPPAQYGWIRVLCDRDATPERIGRIQHSLYERGYYRGAFNGRYDEATATAVAQFQASAHIAHGGYLSIQTIDALDARGGGGAYPSVALQGPPLPDGYAYQASASASASAYAYQGGYAQPAGPCQQACAFGPPPAPPVVYAPPPVVYAQPVYAQPQVYAAPNCGCYAPLPPPPCCAAVQGYNGGVGYGYPAYASASASASASAYAGAGYASAGASAAVVQNGWLTWDGKSRF